MTQLLSERIAALKVKLNADGELQARIDAAPAWAKLRVICALLIAEPAKLLYPYCEPLADVIKVWGPIVGSQLLQDDEPGYLICAKCGEAVTHSRDYSGKIMYNWLHSGDCSQQKSLWDSYNMHTMAKTVGIPEDIFEHCLAAESFHYARYNDRFGRAAFNGLDSGDSSEPAQDDS